MKRAIIDIGTNSTILLIGQLNNKNQVESILQRFNITRIGENVSNTKKISEASLDRTIKVLKEYDREIKTNEVHSVHVVGTHALRVAENTKNFKFILKDAFDWNLEIISEEEEAKYSYLGALDSAKNQNHINVVMDVGGGSTEIIHGENSNMSDYTSIPIGAVQMAELWGMKANLDDQDQNEIIKQVERRFNKIPFIEKIRNSETVISVGGTITTLAAIDRKMSVYSPDKINGVSITQKMIKNIFDNLNQMDLNKRKQAPGLSDGREDIILYGTLIILAFMKYFSINSTIISDRGLRFGYLRSLEMNSNIKNYEN